MCSAFLLNHTYFDFRALYILQSMCTDYIVSTVGLYFIFIFGSRILLGYNGGAKCVKKNTRTEFNMY